MRASLAIKADVVHHCGKRPDDSSTAGDLFCKENRRQDPYFADQSRANAVEAFRGSSIHCGSGLWAKVQSLEYLGQVGGR
jgi:hypothetical protein